MKPTARRTELGNELRKNVDLLLEIRATLWPRGAPKPGEQVREALDELIKRHLRVVPKRGKGARRRRFVRHVLKVFGSYERGLFHSYDDPRIPQTSNELEGKHGKYKYHLRKATGRGSTTGGPAETFGELLAGALDEVQRNGFGALKEKARGAEPEAYAAARKRFKEIREPARRYRSIQRNPQRHLDKAIAEWERL